MKITWASNAPWAPTGYGTQTSQVVRRLKAAGHDVAVAANYGLMATAQLWTDDIPVLPQGKAPYSDDILPAHHASWTKGEPGWIVTLYDTWVYNRPHLAAERVASWVPVDHYPVPPEVAAWCREHFTIAMSRFGQQALKEQGIDARYVPHAVERVFAPTTSDFRRTINVPDDAFLVTINAANKGGFPPRKAWAENLSAFALFAQKHEDAYLYLHTDLIGMAGAPDLRVLLTSLKLPPERVRVVPQYEYLSAQFTDRQLAAIYTASDVLLATSMGEGFGVPTIEAQACGTPVIVTDFAASAELAGPGWKVRYQPWWDAAQSSWFALPLVASIRDALEQAYADRGNVGRREEARTFAAQYDADLVFETYWRPIVAELEALLHPRVKRQQRRREARRKKAA